MLKTGCIILAGGKGIRLGQEKAWVELGGISLLQRVVSNVEFLNSEVIIVKATEQELPLVSASINLRVIPDAVTGKGPLAGIFVGLVNSKYNYNLILACDMPLVNKDLVNYMRTVAQGYYAVVPRPGSHLQPLQAVYSKNCIFEIENLLSSDDRSVLDVFDKVRTRYVESTEIKRFDPSYRSFVNINTPADLIKAEKLLQMIKS